jgi:hypothetical protein
MADKIISFFFLVTRRDPLSFFTTEKWYSILIDTKYLWRIFAYMPILYKIKYTWAWNSYIDCRQMYGVTFLDAISTPLSDNIMNEEQSREHRSSIIRTFKRERDALLHVLAADHSMYNFGLSFVQNVHVARSILLINKPELFITIHFV